jgi:hypothetical protein
LENRFDPLRERPITAIDAAQKPNRCHAMEFVFEVIIQFLGEMFLQGGFELLMELGQHILIGPPKKPRNPIFSAIGFILWGAIAGGISLWILPHSPISDPVYRTINLILTPLAAGGFMMLIGRKRIKKGQPLVGLDRFGYAFAFALSMAIVRFVWAK